MTTLAIPDRSAHPALLEVDVLDACLAGLGPNTLRAYEGDLADFAAFLGHPGASGAVRAFLALDGGRANATALYYRAHLLERKLAPATVGRRLAALRTLVKCARILGRVTWSIEIGAPKVQTYRDTRGPGDEGWKSMLRQVRHRADEGDVRAIRDLAIVRLLHDLGMRRGELCALDYESLDQERGTVAVVGKGHRQAVDLTLPDPTIEALADWLAVRGTGPGPLFTRLDNAGSGTGRLTGEAVRLIVKGLGARAGIERAVRPHGLRHQAITSVLAKTNGNLEAGMKFARHANPKTTMVYNDNRRDVAGEMARLVAEDGCDG